MKGPKPSTTASPETEILTREQAARLLQLSVQSIDLLIRRHELRASRIGRRVLIKKSDLLRTLEAFEIQ